MSEQTDQATDQRQVAQPLQRMLPELHCQRNGGVARQAAVEFWLGGIVEDVNHARAADTRGIVNAGVVVAVVIAELLGALFGEELHVVLGAEVQAASGAGLDASRLEPLADAIRAEGAFVHALGDAVELWNVEGAAGDAIAAADAVILLEVHNAVGVLDDGAVGGASFQASRFGAVHALVLTHQPLQCAVFALVLVEEDQVPVIPPGVRHRLVGIVEGGLREGHVVPLDAGHFAGLAADAGGGVDEFADGELALGVFTGDGAGVAGNFLNA